MTEPKKDLGIGQPIDENWLKIQDEVRTDVEWALEAGQGKFLVACFAVVPAGTLDAAGLPPDVQLPRDNDKLQVAKRIHAYFPYGDFPVAMRQFREFLSLLLRERHQRQMDELEGQKLEADPEPPKPAALPALQKAQEQPQLTVVPPDSEFRDSGAILGGTAIPMLCFAHGGSPSAQQHNLKHGFACPKCESAPKEETPSDANGQEAPDKRGAAAADSTPH